MGTFNIQHGVHYAHFKKTNEKLIDLANVSEAIKQMKLDLCGLNEVRNFEMIEGDCNQAKVIAEKLGYHFVFAKAIDYRGGEYGNALVSKYPILSYQCIPMKILPQDRLLNNRFYEDRVVLCAEILIDNQVLKVFITHLGLNEDELSLGVHTVCNCVKNWKQPIILMGDFNFDPNTTYYKSICEVLYDTSGLIQGDCNTFPSDEPIHKIDYIFINNYIKVKEASIPSLTVSDHRPYVVNITF